MASVYSLYLFFAVMVCLCALALEAANTNQGNTVKGRQRSAAGGRSSAPVKANVVVPRQRAAKGFRAALITKPGATVTPAGTTHPTSIPPPVSTTSKPTTKPTTVTIKSTTSGPSTSKPPTPPTTAKPTVPTTQGPGPCNCCTTLYMGEECFATDPTKCCLVGLTCQPADNAPDQTACG